MSTVTSVSSQTSFLPSTQASSKASGNSGASSGFSFDFLENGNSGTAYTGSGVSLWGENAHSAFAQNTTNLKKSTSNGSMNGSMGETLADAVSTQVAFAQTQENATLAGGKLSINPDANKLTLPSGITLALPFTNNGNFRVTEGENGTVTVVTDMLRVTYDKDGNRIASERGSFDPLTGTEGKDYIVNRNGTYVNAGGGDDVIFQLSNSATISAGAGDDEIIFGDTVFDELSIDLGDGDDTIESHSLRVSGDLDISAGDGDDSITIGTLQATNLSLDGGDGSDNIQIGSLLANSFTLDGGEGNNTISILTLLNNSEDTTHSISVGNGDNEISIGNGVFRGEIVVGDGDNAISLDQIKEATLQGGYGENTVNINAAYLSSIHMGGKQSTVDIKDAQDTSVSIAEEKAMVNGALIGQVLDSILNEQKQNGKNAPSEKAKASEDTTADSSQAHSQRNTIMFKDDMAQQIENILAQSISPLRDTQQNTAV